MYARLVLLLVPLSIYAVPVAAQTTFKCTQAVPTQVIAVMNQRTLSANQGGSVGATNVDGCRFVNIHVHYRDSIAPTPPPQGGTPSVSLGVTFGIDSRAGSRYYVNLESNLPSPQPVNFVEAYPKAPFVTSLGTHTLGGDVRYIVRVPVMGPWVRLFPFNHASVTRFVSTTIYATY
jgi:hypothetical protein